MSQEHSPATPRGTGVDRELLAVEVEAEADRLERESVYSAQGITRDWLRSVAEGIRKISVPSEMASSEALKLAEEWKGRGDDAGRLSRAVIDSAVSAIERKGPDGRPFGVALAMAVLQSSEYSRLDDAARSECDSLLSLWNDWVKGGMK